MGYIRFDSFRKETTQTFLQIYCRFKMDIFLRPIRLLPNKKNHVINENFTANVKIVGTLKLDKV